MRDRQTALVAHRELSGLEKGWQGKTPDTALPDRGPWNHLSTWLVQKWLRPAKGIAAGGPLPGTLRQGRAHMSPLSVDVAPSCRKPRRLRASWV